MPDKGPLIFVVLLMKLSDECHAKDSSAAPTSVHPVDDIATQMYDDIQQSGGFDKDVNDEEMMTLAYDLEPVVNDVKTAESEEQSQALDAAPTQVMSELDRSVGDGGKRGSTETASQSSSAAPTQVFDLCDPVRSQSQAATQTFDIGDSRRSNSQSDFIATQVFDAISTTHQNSGGWLCSNSRSSNSQIEPATQVFDAPRMMQRKSDGSPGSNSRPSDFQTEPATQVFDALRTMQRKPNSSPGSNSHQPNSQTEPATQVFDAPRTMQRKSDGSPGSNSHQLNSQTDLLPTQVFCEPKAVATTGSGSSPQQSTQTFSAPNLPRRTSSIGKDGTRVSFSPQSCSTQVFPSESNFPHLALEMSECNDSHEDSCTVTPAALRASSHQVSLSIFLST